MKTLRTTRRHNFNWKDGILLATLAVINVAMGTYLIKRSYFEGWDDYRETFVDFKPRN